ncbi:stearoyl-CoA desaturase-like [Oppia nitens]|uniref:stearoyl-CoA desaturase-like n=1 Tax=Oppia nitens TaxID=1686743 RepID=UPI0023DA0870|nr:stearoyl-CoA desaturase-like [Oppia nitens]
MYMLCGLGVLLGSHRLWTHRSFKAHLSVKIVLMILQTMAMQRSVYVWSRDHRIHHKFSETDADPHNSKRGLFFAHIGWLFLKKHPEMLKKRQEVDVRDLKADPVVMFQKQHMILLSLLVGIIIPVIIPMLLWDETLINAFIANIIRYLYALHSTFLVNSAAHMYGLRPYDEIIEPRESSFAIYFTFGEGYHNFHHTFPYDSNSSDYVTKRKAMVKNKLNNEDREDREDSVNYWDNLYGFVYNSSFFWIFYLYSLMI